MAQGVELPPADDLQLLLPIGFQQRIDKAPLYFRVVQEKEILIPTDVVDRADDEVVVPAGKGLFGRLQILVGLAQLDAPVKPGAPSLGDFQAISSQARSTRGR